MSWLLAACKGGVGPPQGAQDPQQRRRHTSDAPSVSRAQASRRQLGSGAMWARDPRGNSPQHCSVILTRPPPTQRRGKGRERDAEIGGTRPTGKLRALNRCQPCPQHGRALKRKQRAQSVPSPCPAPARGKCSSFYSEEQAGSEKPTGFSLCQAGSHVHAAASLLGHPRPVAPPAPPSTWDRSCPSTHRSAGRVKRTQACCPPGRGADMSPQPGGPGPHRTPDGGYQGCALHGTPTRSG